MEILGFIPARLGSVRFPGKNTVDFGGKSLIQKTIDSAKDSNINRLIVCSDDPKVKSAAISSNVEMWHQPNPFAAGEKHASKVCIWALERLFKQHEYFPDGIMMLFPNCPFRTTQHINESIELFKEGYPSVIGVKRTAPLETLRYTVDGYLYPYVSFHRLNKQTQEVDETFEVNGVIFLTNTMLFQQYESFHIPMSVPYLMDQKSSIDINTFEDYEFAKKLL